jgi:hypothetical protein
VATRGGKDLAVGSLMRALGWARERPEMRDTAGAVSREDRPHGPAAVDPGTAAPKYDKYPSGLVVGIGIDFDGDTDTDADADGHLTAR